MITYTSAIGNRSIPCGIFLNFLNAFDTGNHDILVNKTLEYYGVREVAKDWFVLYIGNRQVVTIYKVTSCGCTLTCGVPQGSVLGPLLVLTIIGFVLISFP